MAGGFRSLLAPWIGGASSTPAPTVSGGLRSLLAPWIGGASSPAAAPSTGGLRSLLAFWLGGASGTEGVAPPVVTPEQFSGGWLQSTYKERKHLEAKIREARDALVALADADTAPKATVPHETLQNVGQKRLKRSIVRLQQQRDDVMLERLRLLVEIDRLEARIRSLDDDVAVILLAALAH